MWTVLLAWVRRSAGKSWLIYALIVAAVLLIFIWRLGSLTPGASPAEASAVSNSRSLHTILHDPVNAPFRLFQHGLAAISLNGWFYKRLPSAIIAIILVISFYRLTIGLLGKVIGLLGTILFASLPLLVISARQASPDIMLFTPLLLMALYAWFNRTTRHTALAWISLLTAAALLVYTPGMVYVILGGFVLCRGRIIFGLIQTPKKWIGAGLILFLVLLAPLVVASVFNLDVLKQVALVPSNLPHATTALKDIGWMASALVARAPAGQSLLVGRLPLLNVLLVALLVFGSVAMFRAAPSKAYSLGALIILAILAAGLNNNLALLALGLPAAAVFISAGLRFLYVEWRSVFPSNPIPKNLAVLLMGVLVIVQFGYGLRYSLVTWPQTPKTRHVYMLK